METYFPYDAGPGSAISEDQWRELWDSILSAGVFRGILGGLAVTANGSGMQVFVATGEAWSKGNYYQNDAPITLTVDPNATSNPRIDRVILRNDFVANTLQVVIRAGTPAVSPAPPALEQSISAWDVPLAQVRVEPGAVTILATKVTDERQYAATAATLDVNADTLEGHTSAFFATAAALATEISNRATADAAEIAARVSAINAEATTRANADAAEATARTNADNAETAARTTAVANEATTRANADNAEAATRASEDKKRPRIIGLGGLQVGAGATLASDFMMVGGTTVVDTLSGSQGHIAFPTAFPNGVVTIVAWLASSNLAGGTISLDFAEKTGFYFFVFNPDGSLPGAVEIQVSWIAIGW